MKVGRHSSIQFMVMPLKVLKKKMFLANLILQALRTASDYLKKCLKNETSNFNGK